MKIIKQLKESVVSYGVQEAFTMSLLENIATQHLTPDDWTNLARACLSGGQYLMWKVANQEYCADTARRNTAANNPLWDLDMLIGIGQYTGQQNQINYHPGVYALTAFSALPALFLRSLFPTEYFHQMSAKFLQYLVTDTLDSTTKLALRFSN